jgi:hypothetical protein
VILERVSFDSHTVYLKVRQLVRFVNFDAKMWLENAFKMSTVRLLLAHSCLHEGSVEIAAFMLVKLRLSEWVQ